jgi:pyruvate/2-oxoglutarate dehydrogenase complex dihydrolipoamide dehydrogenase (E3) component
MTEHADVIVVGMGPGGEDVAGRLAEAGLDVVGIDAELVGGECPYWGCVPSKMMIRAANLVAEARRIPGMAGDSRVQPDWAPVARRIRRDATDTWDDAVAVKRFEDKGGRMVRGWGRPVAGLADALYWTNREAIETEEVPESLAVLGGGPIGVELAQVFCRFGAEVTVMEAGSRLLGPEEPEAGELLEEVFRAEGIDVRTGVAVDAVRHDGERFAITLGSGEPVMTERLLVATGRHPDLRRLNSAAIGVDESARVLPVDDHLRVEGVSGVWAVGDVTGKGAFTHVSMYQADIVVNDIMGRAVVPADYRAVPRVTFTDPEIGSVGLNEQAARDKGLNVRVGRADVSSSTRGFIHKAGNQGYIKLIEDADRGLLVGASSAGPCGGEVLGLLTLAVHAEVATSRLRHMIYAYPTFHRAVEAAVKDLEEG